ncbi:hypothetical protein FQZ97_1079980 [compost metagenome]
MRHAQGVQAFSQGGRIASGHHRGRDARALQQFDAVAVERVKTLDRFPAFREIQPTVGQHPVHVKKHHAHGLRAQQQLGRKVQCGTQWWQFGQGHGAMLTGEDAFE